MMIHRIIREVVHKNLKSMTSSCSARRPFCTGEDEDDDVLFHQNGTTGIIELNRPKALNSLNLSMIRKIYPQMLKWEERKSFVQQVIICGKGEKAFCAGGDIIDLAESAEAGTELYKEFFSEEYTLNYTISVFRLPYIAIIDGITMGGGVGLSIHGAYRVATERTVMAMPETAIGLLTDVGSVLPLSHLPGHLGAFLALTGHRLRGRDLHHAQIATHFVSSHMIPSLIDSLENITSPNSETVSQVLNEFHQASLQSSCEEFSLQPHLKQIDEIFRHNKVEDIIQALMNDNSDWSKKQLSLMQAMSPTSLKITLHHLTEALTATSLADVLRVDYRLSRRCAEGHDFIEGVRSKMIDKDNQPKWNPASISDVSNDLVDKYFSPLPADQEWSPPNHPEPKEWDV